MNQGIKTVIYPVKDIGRAKATFTKLLGVQPDSDQPYYVGFTLGGQQIGLDPNGHSRGMSGPVGYYHVDDIKGSVQSLVDAGGQVEQEPTDVGGGRLIANVKDADGNAIGLLQDPS